jgi:hypothetical protein
VPPSSLISLTDNGAHRDRVSFPSSSAANPICLPEFSTENKPKMEKGTIGDEKSQTLYRWKALGKENTLGKFISGFMHCTSLASEEKETGYKIQLSDLKSNQANWRFRGLCVGPTIQLRQLLARIGYPFYNFHNRIGAQNRSQY